MKKVVAAFALFAFLGSATVAVASVNSDKPGTEKTTGKEKKSKKKKGEGEGKSCAAKSEGKGCCAKKGAATETKK